MKDKERILCAAIWYKDLKLVKEIPEVLPKNCKRGLVVTGHRHCHCIWLKVCLTGLNDGESGQYVQGFLTSKNRFVNRVDALKIAIRENQVLDLSEVRGNKLYSEDLY